MTGYGDDDDLVERSELPPTDWSNRYWAAESDLGRWHLVRGWLEWYEVELDRVRVELGDVRRERDEYWTALAERVDADYPPGVDDAP